MLFTYQLQYGHRVARRRGRRCFKSLCANACDPLGMLTIKKNVYGFLFLCVHLSVIFL